MPCIRARKESPLEPALLQPRSLDDLLLYRLSRLVSVAGARVIRLCEGRYGISRREWRVLSLLAEHEGLLSSQLAERAQLDRARTSRAISSLVAKGLLDRAVRPGDRRQAELRLTAAGRAIHREMFPRVQAINQALLAPLPAGEVVRLGQILDRLEAQAQALGALPDDLPKADRRRGRRERPAPGLDD